MKQTLFSTMVLLLSLTAFPQQIDLVNNTGQTINVFFWVYGTSGPNCTTCNDSYETDIFTISPGTTTFDDFADFDPLGVRLYKTGFCPPSGCIGSLVAGICGQPVWEMVGFSRPGSLHCCWSRVGDTSCGPNNSFSDMYITVNWNVVSPTQIVVTFN